MRIPSILVVLLWGLVSVGGASDSARQGSSRPAENSFSSDQVNSSAVTDHDFLRLPASDGVDRDHRRVDSERDGDVTCYTIESYLVKRQNRDSDVVQPAGHSTCQRASRYGVRKVEQPGTASSR
jgi:hypothetical protein